MTDFVTTFSGIDFDDLIGGTAVKAMTANGTLTVEARETPRGTLLSGTDNAYSICAAGETATAILAHYVLSDEGGEETVTVYTRGLFNRDGITVADGDTIEAHEEELRSVGIYLTHVIA